MTLQEKLEACDRQRKAAKKESFGVGPARDYGWAAACRVLILKHRGMSTEDIAERIAIEFPQVAKQIEPLRRRHRVAGQRSEL